ncbi:MAG: hypothetical protein EA416_07700 [Trueperaceae bacterium]|nr:MAG: hypothetical protein EA416_07700 [Trueperaceae bacterium]
MIAAVERRPFTDSGRAGRVAALFAGLTALAYVLLALGVLGTGGYQGEPGSEGIVLFAAGCYAVGGALVLLRRRWLWILGAVVNALVLVFFIAAYAGDASVLLSTGGIATKVPQVLLQVWLLGLIAGRR